MKRNPWHVVVLSLVFCGAALLSFAGVAHPSAPDDAPFKERVFEFVGDGHQASLTLAYPTPSEVVDSVGDRPFDVYRKTSSSVMFMNFNFTGYFWQGIFGRVGLDVKIFRLDTGEAEWNTLDDLLNVLIVRRANYEKKLKGGSFLNNHTRWLNPEMSNLNGVPCVRLVVSEGDNLNAEYRYYFLLDQRHAINVTFSLIDNSGRPGLAESDWRPRAEKMREKMLAGLKFSIKRSESLDQDKAASAP